MDRYELTNYLSKISDRIFLEKSSLYKKYRETSANQRKTFLAKQTQFDSELIRSIEEVEQKYYDELHELTHVLEYIGFDFETEDYGYFLAPAKLQRDIN